MKYSILLIIIFIVSSFTELVANDNSAIMMKNNNIYITSDGGRTWKIAAKENNTNQFATLEKNGTRYTTDGGKTWQNTDAPRKSAEMETAQSFSVNPNPLSETATIKFYIEQSANVSLKLTDMLGNQIKLIDNQFMDSGSHSVDWDASSVSAGVYYYVLQTGNMVKTGKVVVLK